MPKLRLLSCLCLLGMPFHCVQALEHAVPGEILVQFKDSASGKQKAGLRQQYKASVKTRYRRLPIEHWKLDQSQDVEQLLDTLSSDPNVVFAEPNYRRYPAGRVRAIPNEENYVAQKTPFVQVKLDQLWDKVKGDPSVVVAVIDDAFEITHEDLKDNITQPWDFVDNDNDPSPATCFDTDFNDNVSEEHGTEVLGVIGAATDNGIGIAGAAWNVSVMPLKVGCMFDVAAEIAAFEYAVNTGQKRQGNSADIINTSYGGPMFSSAEQKAIEALRDSGVLLVAAAGNNESDNDKFLDYPSGLNLPNVLAVSGTDLSGNLADWTQFGQTTVDLAAPVSGYRTTAVGNEYVSARGTSFSAPLVASVAALLKSANPAATYVDLRGAILSSVTSMSETKGRLATDGQLDALAAYEKLNAPEPLILIKSIEIDDGVGGNGRIDPDEEITLKIELENVWQPIDEIVATLSSPMMSAEIEYEAFSLQSNSVVEVEFELGQLDLVQGEAYVQIPFDLKVRWNFNKESVVQTRSFYLDYAPLVSGQSVSAKLRRPGNKQDDMHFYHIDVPSGAGRLKVELNIPSGSLLDADLALQAGAYPEIDYAYYKDHWGVGNDTFVAHENGSDVITINSPRQGSYYIAVIAAFDQSGPDVAYTLKATTGRTSAGGCSLSTGKFDPTMVLIVFFSLLYLSRKRLK